MLVKINLVVGILLGFILALINGSALANALPSTVNCETINNDVNLIEMLEDSGELRQLKRSPQTVTFDFKGDEPYSEYLKFARDQIILQNPKGEMLCPIQTPTSKLLYPDLDLDLQLVVDLVAPFELPAGEGKTGILLIHGLTDSPYLFHDIAHEFYQQGISVRTLLLPGHGTAPEALINTSERQWRRAANYAIRQMLKDYDQVLLGGFSTGSALIIDQLVHSKWTKTDLAKIKGTFMWSPASKANSDFAWAAKYLDYIPYLNYISKGADIDFAKYESFPFNAAAQVHKLMSRINGEEKKLKTVPDVPMFVVASEVDQTIDTDQTLKILNRWNKAENRLTKKSDLLIYYGHWKKLDSMSSNIDIHIPECGNQLICSKLLGISHNGIPNSPKNPHYGLNGNYKYCEHHFGDDAYNACKSMPVAPIGEITPENLTSNSVIRRLTFNPHYEHMTDKIRVFLGRVLTQQ